MYQWTARGITPITNETEYRDLDKNGWWFEKLLANDYIAISNMGELPPSAKNEKMNFDMKGIFILFMFFNDV